MPPTQNESEHLQGYSQILRRDKRGAIPHTDDHAYRYSDASMTFSAIDATHMAQLLRLAERGLYTTQPNPRVGCVIAHGERVVGQGWHERAGEPHAEVHALREAGTQARGATAYVTLEPCAHHGRT